MRFLGLLSFCAFVGVTLTVFGCGPEKSKHQEGMSAEERLPDRTIREPLPKSEDQNPNISDEHVANETPTPTPAIVDDSDDDIEFPPDQEDGGDDEPGNPDDDPSELILPHWDGDKVLLFDRAKDWSLGEKRPYVTKNGTAQLNEEEAFDLYTSLIQAKLLVHQFEVGSSSPSSPFPTSPADPIVIGIRGQYPGKLLFNGNAKDQFNDTLVLLFVKNDGKKVVREFPVTTDPGLVDWEPNSSSFLFPTPSAILSGGKTDYAGYEAQINPEDEDTPLAGKPKQKFPYYYYRKGLHRGSYHALRMATLDYRVREHRNGEPTYVRIGSAHNIHAAAGVGSLSFENPGAHVANNSAGCQAIYGQENYYAFVRAVYSMSSQKITDYFLFDGKEVEQMVKATDSSPSAKIEVSVDDPLKSQWIDEWKDIVSLPTLMRPQSFVSEKVALEFR